MRGNRSRFSSSSSLSLAQFRSKMNRGSKKVIPLPSNYQNSNLRQNQQLVKLYNNLIVRSNILNRIHQNLSNDDKFGKELRDSIDSVRNCFIFQLTKKAKEEAEKLSKLLKDPKLPKIYQKYVSQILSVLILLTHLPSNLAIALSVPEENVCNIENTNCPSCNITRKTLPSMYCSIPNSCDDLSNLSKLAENSNSFRNSFNNFEDNTNYKNFDQNESNGGDTVICRICEKVIPLDLIEKHSQLCVEAHQAKYQFLSASDRLKKFNKKLSIQLSVKFPGEKEQCVSYLYVLLYLYFTIDNAITIKCNDFMNPDGLCQLRTIHNQLHHLVLPRSAEQYSTLFTHANNIIFQKLSALNEITHKSVAIAQTTIDHTYGNIHEAQLSDFQFLDRLSAGAFAKVYLARKTTTGDLFAIKVIPKSHVNLKNQVRSVTNERDILMKLNYPYMINFYYSFVRKNNMYLVMEYIPGGDIYSLLQNVGSLDEVDVKNYIVQVIQALQFLRQHQIIHRDLKPDNILIDSNGYLRLTDFGLSFIGLNGRQQDERVGTADYMSPEIVLSENHSYSCDYWSLGVMTYEMLYGVPPFHGANEDETFENILTATPNLDVLENVSYLCKDFIAKLLIHDPEKRLGAKRFEDLMDHPWFKDPKTSPNNKPIDWNHIHHLPPVFVPDINNSSNNMENLKNKYFSSRYKFSEEFERDIREDLLQNGDADSQLTYEEIATTPFDDMKANGTSLQSNEIACFSRMSLVHLGSSNEGAAKILRRKRIVHNFVKSQSQHDVIVTPLRTKNTSLPSILNPDIKKSSLF